MEAEQGRMWAADGALTARAGSKTTREHTRARCIQPRVDHSPLIPQVKATVPNATLPIHPSDTSSASSRTTVTQKVPSLGVGGEDLIPSPGAVFEAERCVEWTQAANEPVGGHGAWGGPEARSPPSN